VGEVGDSSAADFRSGATDAAVTVVGVAPAEVILAPAFCAEFTGPELPPGWFARPWAEGGTVYFDNGRLVIDGALVGHQTLISGGRALELSATFAERPDQHAGFGFDYVNVPWCMFSTKWGRRLYARTNFTLVEDKKLPGDWFGTPHRYRIDWRFLYVDFAVDGERLAHLLVPMPPAMRPLVGNKRRGGPPLLLDWVRMSPYPPAGRFTSRVLDAGAAVEWTDVVRAADVPDGTSLDLQWRWGDTPTPDRSWSRWAVLRGRSSRYAQYRAALATADPASTPALRAVTLRYRSLDRSSGSYGSA